MVWRASTSATRPQVRQPNPVPNPNMTSRGALICFSGVPRSGRTTQAKALTKALTEAGVPVVLKSFSKPDSELGRELQSVSIRCPVSTYHVRHLLRHAIFFDSAKQITDFLASGTSVVLDSYVYDTLADDAFDGLSMPWALMTGLGLPRPDMLVRLVVDGATSIARSKQPAESTESDVAEIDKLLGHMNRLTEGQGYLLTAAVEATLPVEEIAAEQLLNAQRTIAAAAEGPPLATFNWTWCDKCGPRVSCPCIGRSLLLS